MPTISDVAQQAGVSPATVSRVLQGAKNVSPDTRARVEQAIEDLGYVPSAAAQSMRSKRTHSVALVVSDIANTFWTTVARGVEDAAHQRDYSVLLCNSDENPVKQHRYIDFLIGQGVDGVIIAPFDSDAGKLDKLRQRDIPTVVVDRRIEGWNVDSVSSDSVAGARALVQHLIELGHERIGMISGPATTSTAEDRVAGYCMALAEADIPIDPSLIKKGEFRSAAGRELTHQLLNEGLGPTAIFAANNTIAMGIIDALAGRGLRVPQDIALVCFDDLPITSHVFPFLTVVAQPVYDIGVNAAQLLLSRLDSEVRLQPRHVVLPSRLIVRHSCGSQLQEDGRFPLSLPIAPSGFERSVMVKPLGAGERRELSRLIEGGITPVYSRPERMSDYDRSDVNRLLEVLQHREADRVPYIEFEIASKAIFEYVLEHELEYDTASATIGQQPITPEDHVEFALRLGMDAVPCNFIWEPSGAGNGDLGSPPLLTDQLSNLERYLRAAQGTNVGIAVRFSSFFQPAMVATGVMNAPHRFGRSQQQLEQVMDVLLENQERAMRVVCDRFGSDLALVLIRDSIADHAGLMIPSDLFMPVFQPRMMRLIGPSKEHDKLLLMHTGGKVDQILPILREMGFDGVYPVEPEFNNIYDVRKQWAGRLAIVGNVPTALLARGNRHRIQNRVREYCTRLAPGGGYVLSSSGIISRDVPPANLVAMARAVHRYGRYGSLGDET